MRQRKLRDSGAIAALWAVLLSAMIPGYIWAQSTPPASAAARAAHATIQRYDGPATCVRCHQDEARRVHGSVHYQQNGPADFVTNIAGNGGEGPADRPIPVDTAIGINTYCGSHQSSPRFTCAGCHVGNGRFPKTPAEFSDLTANGQLQELSNIDCMMCHQEVYKRFPDPTGEFEPLTILNAELQPDGSLVAAPGTDNPAVRDGLAGIPVVDPITKDFQFVPAGTDNTLLEGLAANFKMPITALEAARTVHPTSRRSCLNCHAGAAGANGAKRGDLSTETIDPSITLDMHMSAQGPNLTCSDCHNVDDATGKSLHRVRGRGVDLRPNDVSPELRFTCDNSGCHSSRPHGDFDNRDGTRRDTHALRVACQSCHIPSYAKATVGTEVARDWQHPHLSQTACNGRGGWLPEEIKGGLGNTSLIPSYAWFNGESEVYYVGEKLDKVPTIPLPDDIAADFVGVALLADANPATPARDAFVLGMPHGSVSDPAAKLYPMKEHWGKLARHDAGNELVAHSTFEFFRTGSFCRAVAVGLGLEPNNQRDSAFCGGLPGSLEMPTGSSVVAVHTYQTLNHGVEREENALRCGACHASQSGGPLRMDLQGALGYALKGPLSAVCTQCHGREDRLSFRSVHDKHVRGERIDCSSCHNFSRASARNLRTGIVRD